MVKKNNLRKVFAAFACLACATTCAAAFAACGSPEEEGSKEAALTSGTYWTDYHSDGMGGLDCVVHITLDAEKNTYYYSSYYVMDNEQAHATFVNSESGTYTDDGENVVFKTEGKADLTATISDNAFTLEKDVLGMNISHPELKYEKGDAPFYVVYNVDGDLYEKVGYKNATDSVVAIQEPAEKTGYTFSWGTVPETAGTGATVNGVYTADKNEGGEEEEGSEAALTSGTYWTDYHSDGMGGIDGTVHITLDAENFTYYFSSYYVMSRFGFTCVVSESGTYTDDGENLVFKTEGEDDLTATISDAAFTLEKDVLGMGMSHPELTYEKGDAPVYVTYYVDAELYEKVGYKNATDEVVAIDAADDISGYTFYWIGLPATAGTGASVYGIYTSADDSEGTELVSGNYNVDVTWSAMYEYNKALEYHVIINAEENTFEILNQTADSKGSGKVELNDEVYTLVYTDEKDEGNTSTFTYDSESKTITFTSFLWINGTKFNRVGDDGETFVPYTAVKMNEVKNELAGGNYNVDVTWSAMYQYNKALEYHVIIDAEENTFEILNQASESKSSGRVEFNDGVYTLVYTDAKDVDNTTTFVYNSESQTITFTSFLWVNGVKFNRVDEDGVTFVPYTAVISEN